MSRLGKKTITIPAKTEVAVAQGTVTVKGPKGTLSRVFKPLIDIAVTPEGVVLTPARKTALTSAFWGTYASHISNMIKGVTESFQKKLILEGVGYKVEVKGKNLQLALGFSHPVVMVIPEGLTVTAEKNIITISGIDKELVGHFAAKVRDQKKPEPYKGKGIRYENEVIRRKEGKKAV